MARPRSLVLSSKRLDTWLQCLPEKTIEGSNRLKTWPLIFPVFAILSGYPLGETTAIPWSTEDYCFFVTFTVAKIRQIQAANPPGADNDEIPAILIIKADSYHFALLHRWWRHSVLPFQNRFTNDSFKCSQLRKHVFYQHVWQEKVLQLEEESLYNNKPSL